VVDEDEKLPVPVGPTVVGGYGTLDVVADDSPEVVGDGNAELDVMVEDSDVRIPLCVDDAELPVPVGVTTVEFEAVGYGAVGDSEDVSLDAVADVKLLDKDSDAVPLFADADVGVPVPVGSTAVVEFEAVG
jgi:hypothetical protein